MVRAEVEAEQLGLRDPGDAGGAAREAHPVVGHDADDLPEAQGHDGQVVAAEAEGGVAEDRPRPGGEKPADQQVHPHEPPVRVDVHAEAHLEDLDEDDGAVVAADGEEGHIAQVEQPGEAHHDVEPAGEHHVDDDDGEERGPAVGSKDEGQRHGDREDDPQLMRCDPRRGPSPVSSRGQGIELAPESPCASCLRRRDVDRVCRCWSTSRLLGDGRTRVGRTA